HAEPIKKTTGKTASKQKQVKDADEDQDKPVQKKSSSSKAREADSDEDNLATKKSPKLRETEKKKEEAAPPSAAHPAAVSNINLDDLTGFNEYPKQVRSLVESALALTHLGLTYKFGGSNPSEGGMDCSGTIYHVLKFQGLKDVPRQSDEMCAWVRDHSELHITTAAKALTDADFEALKPGDMLFWTGTYKTDRKLPITHVMLYLGKLKKTGKPVVFGASDGRYYAGERRSGVSVFDLSMPREGSESVLYGYGATPGLMPAAPREQLAKIEPKKPTEVALAGDETVLPAIVVPSRGEDPFQILERKKIPEAEEKSPPIDRATDTAQADMDEDVKPAVGKKKSSDEDEGKSAVATKDVASFPARKRTSTTSNADEDNKPAEKRKADAEEPKAKAPVGKESTTLNTTRSTVVKKKPQPSARRVALDETNETLRRAGKSIRSVFE
ncbi:MAG: cell wall-associated NlpC family hydrolase, partial [Verrucomicrobiaceae bacterium]|nr:cell wall-associated NlpC family hydrolase [Verrucomicrobiaceae bacterium]